MPTLTALILHLAALPCHRRLGTTYPCFSAALLMAQRECILTWSGWLVSVMCMATGAAGCATMWVFCERLAARNLSDFYLVKRTGTGLHFFCQLWQAMLVRAAPAQAGGWRSRHQPLFLCLAFWRLLLKLPGCAAEAAAVW